MEYITLTELVLYTEMLVGVITLCYLIFHKKK